MRKSVTAEQMFDPGQGLDEGKGLNVLLYGAVGTGKSTVVRKLVLDWCAGSALSQFKLLVPFSCEDLSQLSKSTSLRDLVGRKYVHLRKTPFLSGDNDQARDVLFIFNGMEKMKLDFRIGTTELCSDPNEAVPAGAAVVNLLRKYLLPEVRLNFWSLSINYFYPYNIYYYAENNNTELFPVMFREGGNNLATFLRENKFHGNDFCQRNEKCSVISKC